MNFGGKKKLIYYSEWHESWDLFISLLVHSISSCVHMNNTLSILFVFANHEQHEQIQACKAFIPSIRYDLLSYKCSNILLSYPRKLDFWKPIVDSIISRLSSWKCKFLLFGGRLILLKFVLSSLSVYFLSFFKAPAGIISSIESLFNFFFWGAVRILGKFHGWIGTLFVCRGMRVD